VEVIPRLPRQEPATFVLFKETPAASLLRRCYSGEAKAKKHKADKHDSEIVRLNRNWLPLKSICKQEQEATEPETQSATEEILSSKRGVTSTNEELETAKEEIQATNEELKTNEDECRVISNTGQQSDLRNLLSSVNIPILILGKLSIRRFTRWRRKFNLIPTDVGRPLKHIKPNINVPNLEQLFWM